MAPAASAAVVTDRRRFQQKAGQAGFFFASTHCGDQPIHQLPPPVHLAGPPCEVHDGAQVSSHRDHSTTVGAPGDRSFAVIPNKRKRAGGILFLVAGAVFFGAAAAMHQASFYGVGAAFIGVGVAFLAKSRKCP
jgi:hypothetical protein